MTSFDFSKPQLNDGYKLKGVEIDTTLDSLLEVPRAVIDSCLSGDILPPSFQDDINGDSSFDDIINKFSDEEALQEIIEQHSSYIAAVIAGFVIAVLIPLTGLICCCVSCCCRKGGSCCCTGSFTNKRQGRSPLRVAGITILGLIACAGFVWNFAAINRMYSTELDIPKFVDDTVGDFELFVENIELELDFLLENNFNETITDFDETLNNAVKDMQTILDHTKEEIHYNEVIETVQIFSVFVTDYNNIASQVQTLVTEIDTIGDQCGVQCDDFINSIRPILAPISEANFGSDVTDVISQVDSTLAQVSSEFDNILTDFQDEYFAEINVQIEKIRKTLVDQNTEIKKALQEIKIKRIDWGEGWDDYTNYFYIGATVFISFLLLIVILFLVPGWNIAKIGAAIYMTVGILYFLIIPIFFAVGSLGDKIVCTSLEEPSQSEVLPLFDDMIRNVLKDAYQIEDSEMKDFNITLTNVLTGIKDEKSIYPLLQLYHLYDVYNLRRNWQKEFEIDTYEEQAKTALKDAIDATLAMKDNIPDINGILGDVTQQIEDILQDNIKKVTETDIMEMIPPNFPALVQQKIDEFVEDFNGLKSDVIDAISIFNDGSGSYDFNLNERATNISTEFDNAFNYIGGDGRAELEGFLGDFIAQLLGVVQTYLDFAVSSLDTRVGRSKPLNNMITALDSVICDAFVDSLNLAWTGLGWICLLLFFPMSIWVLAADDWPYNHNKKSKKYKDQWNEMKDF